MAKDRVRRAQELDAAARQLGVGGVDVIDAEVEHRRLVDVAVLALAEEEARTAAVEEGEVAEGLDVGQLQDVPVPVLRLADVADLSRDLTERAELKTCARAGATSLESAVPGRPLPAAQLLPALQPQLADGVGDVELHGVQADAHPPGDDAIAHAVPHRIDDAPFGGGEDIRVPGSAALGCAHGVMLVRRVANYTPPAPTAGRGSVMRGVVCCSGPPSYLAKACLAVGRGVRPR